MSRNNRLTMLDTMVANVLNYSRLERGSIHLHPVSGDLAGAVRDCLARLGPAHAQAHVAEAARRELVIEGDGVDVDVGLARAVEDDPRPPGLRVGVPVPAGRDRPGQRPFEDLEIADRDVEVRLVRARGGREPHERDRE